jgi:hypothetical protein
MRARTLRRAAERAASKLDRQASVVNESAGQATVVNEPPAMIEQQSAVIADQSPVADEQPTTPAAEPSAARLAANRANAKLSTGPSPEGLAASCQNHTIHGLARHSNGTFKLLTSEDPAGFEALKHSLAEEHKAGTPTEAILINAMAESHWLADRAQRLLDTCIDPGTGTITNEKAFSLYLRYQTTHKRSFHKSLSEIAKLRAEKRKAEIGFEAQKLKQAAEGRASEGLHLKKEAQNLKREEFEFKKTIIESRKEVTKVVKSDPGDLKMAA